MPKPKGEHSKGIDKVLSVLEVTLTKISATVRKRPDISAQKVSSLAKLFEQYSDIYQLRHGKPKKINQQTAGDQNEKGDPDYYSEMAGGDDVNGDG